MSKRLWLAAGFLAIVIPLMAGCVGCGKAIKPLTSDEKDTMIETALNHPEVSKWLETADIYQAEVGWVAIGWRDGKATGWSRLDYEEIADGNLPSDITYPAPSVSIHPRVQISVGEPVGKFISVAFDRETKEVVDIQLMPGR